MLKAKGLTALSASKMAKRISDRKDNIYDERIIKNILNMYMDEIRTAMINGERVQISKVGTIIPEVKTRLSFNLPRCNKDGGNPPYTKLRIYCNHSLNDVMNRTLEKNIEDGIYGLAKTLFSRQQMDILKHSGYVPQNAAVDDEITDDETMEDMEE